jgi:hypothetical protein
MRFLSFFAHTLSLGNKAFHGVSSDGRVLVSGSWNSVIAHHTKTDAVLWQKTVTRVEAMRIYECAVLGPVNNDKTVVRDVTTGHQLHTFPLPVTRYGVRSVYLFDGLKSGVICLVGLLNLSYDYYINTTNNDSLERG